MGDKEITKSIKKPKKDSHKTNRGKFKEDILKHRNKRGLEKKYLERAKLKTYLHENGASDEEIYEFMDLERINKSTNVEIKQLPDEVLINKISKWNERLDEILIDKSVEERQQIKSNHTRGAIIRDLAYKSALMRKRNIDSESR